VITNYKFDNKKINYPPDKSNSLPAPTHERHFDCQTLAFLLTAPASLIGLCFIISIFFVNTLSAQTNGINQPKTESFTPLKIDQYYTNSNVFQQNQEIQTPAPTPTSDFPMGANAYDIMNQSYRMVEQQTGVYVNRPYLSAQQNQQASRNFILNNAIQSNANAGKPNNQQKEILNILNEIHSETNQSNYPNSNSQPDSKSFTNAFNTLNDMLTGKTKQSISKAYFAIESAYGSTYLNEKEYNEIINQSASFIKQWLQQNKLNPTKNEDLQYGIQKFMKDTLSITIKLPEQKTKTITHAPFTYDYNDFKAEKDHRNYFISKCLATGTGQCNSLPGTYLSIAEKLGAKTYLSFAPQHSFIKYRDSKGAIHSYEPTSNWKISDKWYIENLGIKSEAIQSGIYLDTLNKKMIVANCILDLAFGYLKKNGASDGKFINDCINTAMQYFPRKNNITAYFIKGSLLARQLETLLRSHGIKDIKDIDKVEGARTLYQELQRNEEVIKQLGFQDMPESMYLELMQSHEFKGKMQQQQNINTKQKRNLFSSTLN